MSNITQTAPAPATPTVHAADRSRGRMGAGRVARAVVGAAIAATSVAISTAGSAPTVAADPVIRYQGEHCHGREVQRCMWFNYDTANRRMAGYGRVRDAAGGSDWDVSVNRISIQWHDGCPGARWIGSQVTNDFDDWFGNYENAKTGLYNVVHPVRCTNSTPQIRVKAYMQWKPAGSSAAVGEWKYSRSVADPRF